jgi:hypothetical protein
MYVSRFIMTQAVVDENNELIPLWDERIVFSKDELCGNKIEIKGKTRSREYFSVVECILDIQDKTLSKGIVINHYPSEKDLRFKKGDVVLYEVKHRELVLTKIIDIIYENYDLSIKRGHQLESYETAWYFKKEERLDLNSLYAIKTWNPTYIIEDGSKVKFVHSFYKKNF